MSYLIVERSRGGTAGAGVRVDSTVDVKVLEIMKEK